MAQKLVGRYGSVFLRSLVTRKGGRTLPISRTSRKLEAAIPLLMANLAVDFQTCTVDITIVDFEWIYGWMSRLNYSWNGQSWQRKYSPWIKVEVKNG